MISLSEDVDYGFAVGRVRAREATLLDRARYERLVRAADAREFRAALADTHYGSYLGAEGEAESLEAVFNRAAGDNFAFLSQYCIDHWVLDTFRLRVDIHNLKLELKQQALGREPGQAGLLEYGNWSPEQLRALAGAEPKSEPAAVREAVAALRTAGVARDPAFVDGRLDRLEQQLALELARPSRFLLGLLELGADTRNLVTFFRVRFLDQEAAALEQSYLPGGTVPLRVVVELLDADWDVVSARFRLSRYHRLVDEGLSQMVEQKSLARMERTGREMELTFLKLARYATFGHEPLVGYHLFRENELTNLRLVAAAKAARRSEAACRELVAYVD